MTALTKPKNWMDWVGVATLLGVTLQFFFGYSIIDWRAWAALGIMLIFIFSQGFFFQAPTIQTDRDEQKQHLQFAFLTLLTLGLFYIDASINGIIVIYFLLSAHILSVMLPLKGYLWIGVWSLIVTFMILWAWEFSIPALMVGFGVACGMIFMGSAANAQRRAEIANTESQRLLLELQSAHQKLQEYAQKNEEFAIAQERNRLAREMHDTLGHRLTVAATQLEGVQRLLTRDPEKATRMVETVRQQVVDGLAELRHTVATLHSPLEEEMTLSNALAHLTGQFQEATGIQTELKLSTPLPPLSHEHHHVLYRTVQESLTNVQRHAQATKVQVELTTNNTPSKTIQIRVVDNGIGFAEEQSPDSPTENQPQRAKNNQSFGLHGLRERAEQLQGVFNIKRANAGGTEVRVCLPL